MGTLEYPYKTLDQAFIEVWNFWTDLTHAVEIRVMEETNNTIWYKERPLLMFMRDSITLKTYTIRTDPEDATKVIPPRRAKIHVTNMISFVWPWNTKFSLMGGQKYDMTQTSVAGQIKKDEVNAIEAAWYSIIAIRSAFTLDSFDVTNQLKL
jgi:hypothetical protein